MRSIKVTFDNRDSLVTSINGTDEEILRYYVGNLFNVGCGPDDCMATAVSVEFLDKPEALVMTSRQDKSQMTQPYKVCTSCGHIVIRRMRPATAGVAYSEDVVLEAPNGRACEDCEAKSKVGGSK